MDDHPTPSWSTASIRRERSEVADGNGSKSPDHATGWGRPGQQSPSSTQPPPPRAKSEDSEIAIPETASSARQPTPVGCPLLSVEQDDHNRRVKVAEQRVKQEVIHREVRWKEELRNVKRELEQDCEQSVKYEDPSRRCEDIQQPIYDPYAETELPPRHRLPLQPLEPLLVAPWPRHRETVRRDAIHHNDGATLFGEVETSLPFVDNRKYGSGIGCHYDREQRQSIIFGEYQHRQRSQSRYHYPRYSRLPEPSWDHPHEDREPYRPRSPPYPPYDYHGGGRERALQQYAPQQHSPQNQVPHHQELEQQQRRQPEQPYPYHSYPHERAQEERQLEARPDLPLNQTFQPPDMDYSAGYTRPRTPLSHSHEEDDDQDASHSENTGSRKQRAENEQDHRHKRARSGHERTEQTHQPGPSRSWPTVGSARQQNHSTRELRPNDNVIRFGLDVWLHGPRSTTGPLTSDGCANSFDNTVTISGGGSFTFTSTALPADTTISMATPNTEGPTATVAATVAVTTAVTSAVTAAITTAAGSSGRHRRSRSRSIAAATSPSAEDRAARRARLLQEQRNQLRRVNEQQMQGYDEVVRRQTMWRVAHEAEQLQWLQGWRWEHDPALATQGVILPPLQAPLQPPPQFRADSSTSRGGYTLPLPTMPGGMAPVDTMFNQFPRPDLSSPSVPTQCNVTAINNVFSETLVQQNSFVDSAQPVDMSAMRFTFNAGQDQQQYTYGDIPAPITGGGPNSWSTVVHDDNQPLMSPPQVGPPTRSPQSPETPQFYNTTGEYTHHPSRGLLGNARPSWTAVREDRFGADGQSSVGYGNICYCNDCRGQSNQYDNNGASH